MPVDVSGKEKRPSRRAGYGEELKQIDQELKRSRGEMACLDCTRLKIKCDKKIPCSSCVRRGFSHLCPNSSLDSRDRPPPTDSEALRVKLLELSERNRQLENALKAATADLPTKHPLLSDEVSSTKRRPTVNDGAGPVMKQERDLIDDFGTLTISNDGASRFLGRTGGGESQMMSDLLVGHDFPSPIESNGHPVSTRSHRNAGNIRQAEERMPLYERATALCETYLQQASWFFRLVRRPQLIDELLIPIYKRMESSTPLPSNDDVLYRHKLALLLSAFAMGALWDLTLPPYNDEAHTYYLLSCSLVDLESAAECPSLAIVQVLCTLCTYCTQSGRIHSMDRPLAMLGYVSTLAASVHRDPARWKLDTKVVQQRREVFWQLFVVLNWQGIKSGRPLNFTLPFIDTEMPDDFEQALSSDGRIQEGGWRYMYTYSKEILYELNALSNKVGPVKYSDIIELDRKIHEFGVPDHLQARPTEYSWENDGPYTVMQRFLINSCHNTTFIELHRNYFAKALLECPSDPLSSQYASSFMSTYRASMTVLRNLREHFDVCPDFVGRVLVAWIHAFSALVVLGAVVIRGPTSSVAPAAMIELTLGVGLFEKAAAADTQWAKRSLALLVSIREKALATYARYGNGEPKVDRSITEGRTGPCGDAVMSQFCRPSLAKKNASGNQSGRVTYLSLPSPLSSDSTRAFPPANGNTTANNMMRTPKSPEQAVQTHELKLLEQLTDPPNTFDKPQPLSLIPDGVFEQDLAAFLTTVSQSHSATVPFSPTPGDHTYIPQQPEVSLLPQRHDGPNDLFGSTGPTGGEYHNHHAEFTSALDMEAIGIPSMDTFGMPSMDVGMDESWSTFLQDTGFLLNPMDPLNTPSFV
ncbi:hypothetical protein BD410DRAFT_753452 [Rickenella mellea]|uniref:Zn(2)-C6 fungal-type domain-containing protein n=1 Tax=Rickenella mellea TaxID=50990 RepID=A0A4Y7PS10_9AGAM|nr:hypothetical protein BD410DRAFT_753452 [Rickenella mellea]